MKNLVIAVIIMLLPVSALGANDSGVPLLPKNLGIFCTHYADYVVQALEARNNEMTPQQAYQSIRGGSSQHYFSSQAAKTIINTVYFQMPDMPLHSTQAYEYFDNQVWGSCVRRISHRAYQPLTKNQNPMAVQPKAKTPVSPALPYSDNSPIPPAKPTDHPKASL